MVGWQTKRNQCYKRLFAWWEHAFLTDQLDEVTSDLEYSYIVCFEFNVCGKHDEYLEQLYFFPK